MKQHFIGGAIILAAMALAGATYGADQPAGSALATPPDKPVIDRPEGRYEIAWLRLQAKDKAVPLFVSFRAGKAAQAWFLHVDLSGAPKASGRVFLMYGQVGWKHNGANITGDIKLRLVSIWAPIKRYACLTITADAAIAAGQIKGTWTLASDTGEKSDGQLTGEDGLAKADALAAGKDWPAYFGPGGSARGPDCGRTLVEDLAQSRPVWRLEAPVGCSWGNGPDGRYSDRAGIGGVNNGASTLVIAGGRLYQFYYRPSGPVDPKHTEAAAKFTQHPIERGFFAEFFRPQADVVVLCADAVTGKTIWRSVWPVKSGNYQTHKWRGYNPTPVVADGAVFVADYTNRYYAHDADTGELLWEYGAMANKTVVGNQAWIGPIHAGGVIVALGKSTVGLDPRTGQQKWQGPGGTSAKKWASGGSDYVLIEQAGGKNKPARMVCLDATKGKELWNSEVQLDFGGQLPVVEGSLLIGPHTRTPDTGEPEGGEAIVRAYTLSAAGCQEAWAAEPIRFTDCVGITAVGQHLFVSGNRETRCLALADGKIVDKVDGVGGARTHHAFAADGRVFIHPEGRHGDQTLFMLTADPNTTTPV